MSTMEFVIKGIRGRRRQSWLLLATVTAFFTFITAAQCYFASAAYGQEQRRYDLYGRWEAAQYGLTAQAAQALLQETQPEAAGIAVQAGVFVGRDMEPLGSVGYADAGYVELGRLAPIEGRFPQQAQEAALTLNALDSLGYSYTLGQSITLPLMEWDYLAAGDTAPREAEFTLCGILPSYEIFWNTENQLPVTAFLHQDAVLPLENPPLQQVFYTSGNPGGAGLAAGGQAGAVYNRFAYPEQNPQDWAPAMLIGASLALAFFAASQLFFSALRKRVRQRGILRAVGATKKQLRRLYGLEGLLYVVVALPSGLLLGLGLCRLGLGIQGAGKFFVIPAAPLALGLSLCACASFAGFLLPAVLATRAPAHGPALYRQQARLRKRLDLAMPLPAGELALGILCFVLILLCVGFARWSLLPYQINKDKAAVNITNLTDQAVQSELLTDLARLSDVVEVSALSRLPNHAYISSPSFLQNKMLQDLYQNPLSNDMTGLTMQSADTLQTALCSAEQGLFYALADLCEDPAAARQALASENACILYLPHMGWDPQSNQYRYAGEGLEQADPGLFPGQALGFSISNAVEDSNGQFQTLTMETELVIAGIIRSFPPDFLAVNQTPISTCSVFVSRAMWAEASRAIGYPYMAEGYTNVNLRLRPNAGYVTRQSIAAMVQKRGGMVRANTYDKVEQAYQSGAQGAFLFGVGALLIGGIGLLLLQNVFLSRLQEAQPGMGIMRAIGASAGAIRQAYGRRALRFYLGMAGAATLLGILIQWQSSNLRIQSLLFRAMDLIFTMGGGVPHIRIYPWAAHMILCGAAALYLWLMHTLPLRPLLKNTPMDNMKGI